MSVTIRRLGARGDGIADGPVHVPGTLPGEEVAGEVTAGRMPAPRILRAAPARVAAPCPHYGSCGGCALQHATDAFAAEWKLGQVRDALAARGLAAPLRPIHISPEGARRRATLAGRRTKRGAVVGFHGRASGTLAEIPHCRVLHADILAARPALGDIVRRGASRKGELALVVSRSAAGLDVAVTGGGPAGGDFRAELAALAARHDLARLAWSGDVVVTRRPPVQRLGRAEVVPPPGAFLQATADGAAALVAAVREAVGGARRIVDLYAGCGTFALPLAETAEVHAVEADAAMLAALDRGWRHAPGLRRLTHAVRDLVRNPVPAADLAGIEAAVIDPPRAGAQAQTAEIAASRVGRVAAVSCNPATFARDAAMLTTAGFTLDWVQLVDQFRWSPRIELAAQLTRR